MKEKTSPVEQRRSENFFQLPLICGNQREAPAVNYFVAEELYCLPISLQLVSVSVANTFSAASQFDCANIDLARRPQSSALLERHKFSQSAHENSIFHFGSPARHSEPSASAAESLFWINFGPATNWFMKMEFQTRVLEKVVIKYWNRIHPNFIPFLLPPLLFICK